MDASFGSQLNFILSAAIFLISICVALFDRSKLLRDPKNFFLKHAFNAWLGMWFCLTLVWTLLTLGSGLSPALGPVMPILNLVLIDVECLFLIVCSYAIMAGEEYSASVIYKLVVVFMFCLIYDVVMGFVVVNHASYKLWWLALSEVLTVAADIYIALAFLMRYGIAATPIALAFVAYAVLQRSAYQEIFIAPPASLHTLVGLGIGKALLGCAFFAYFFHPAPDYRRRVLIPTIKLTFSAGLIVRGAVMLLVMALSTAVLVLIYYPAQGENLLHYGGQVMMALVTPALAALAAVLARNLRKRPDERPLPACAAAAPAPAVGEKLPEHTI